MEDQKKAYRFLSPFSQPAKLCDKTLSTLRLREPYLWEEQGKRWGGGIEGEETQQNTVRLLDQWQEPPESIQRACERT